MVEHRILAFGYADCNSGNKLNKFNAVFGISIYRIILGFFAVYNQLVKPCKREAVSCVSNDFNLDNVFLAGNENVVIGQ